MYFKQLEIVGFKSFPHKTKLKFEPGVTAIVGPNGCGKSNVADSIRWVLGEQSAKSLRGSSMDDVIFNGTDLVEPINMAEVSLTLSNEDKSLPIDYNEVTITRRLFRSGESEYILNKTPVRLKDITSLLIGTGMGTSSYSIIEQGKIGIILSTKPEERRELFEEASGIIKYKSKKRETMRRLEQTENNLVRINDIINEVKRQINSIERQAKKAERYKSDFEVMKEMDTKLTAHELKSINRALSKDREHLDALNIEENSVKLKLDEGVALINGHRREMDDIIYKLTDLQKTLSETSLFIDKSRHRIELNTERVSDLKSAESARREELARLEEKREIQEAEIAKIKKYFDEILRTKEDKEKMLALKEKNAQDLASEIGTLEKEVKAAKNRTLDLLALQTKTKNELIKMGADLSNRKSRQRRLEAEREGIKKEKEAIDSALENANKELEISRNKVRDSRRSVDEIKGRLESSACSLDEFKKRIAENKSALNSLKSREEILREMIETFEGYDRGVKLFAEAVKNGVLNRAVGVIADMIEAKEGFEPALEAALGKRAQAIVVENKEALKAAIGFLAENKGAAHFVIFDEIKESRNYSRNRARMAKKGANPLRSFVRIGASYAPYQAIADYLLDDIYVADTADVAHEICGSLPENIKFVTKDGSLIERGYSFGGFTNSPTQGTSIIGRRAKLEQVIDEEARLEKETEALQSQLSEEKNVFEELKNKAAEAEGAFKKEEIEFANVLSKKERVEESRRKTADELSVIELEAGEVNELISEIALRGDELNKRLNENENEYRKAEELIALSEEAVRNKTKEKNNLLFETTDIKSKIDFLKNTQAQESKNMDRERALLEEFKTAFEDREREARDSENKIESLLKEAEDLEKEINIKEAERLTQQKDLDEISEKKKALSQELREGERVSREKETALENVRDQIRNFEIRTRENELKIVNIKDRMREAYKMSAEELNIETEEELNWEELKNQVEVLKIKLEKLGPVNLVAIEEHKELEERFSFLTQQHEDLLQAKESLHKAIIKINKTTKALFIDTFQKIQVEFRNYFRMLFGGGHAELLLLDESDVLESGIEIVARPPGKKLQNLLLLSGGEKALTAIALLFAMFKVKPSPFCILDEVDAPLDESNIGRFTRILNEFLKLSQFIIITHSKRTMQMANILYGITMEEKGVSKIVSVKFAEDEKEGLSKKEEVLV